MRSRHPVRSCHSPPQRQSRRSSTWLAFTGLLSTYSKTCKSSHRLAMILEKNRQPHTCPVKPLILFYAIAKTLNIHRIIVDRLSPRPGWTTRWKWLPIKQKFSSRKSYFRFARFTTDKKSSFIELVSRIISLRLARAVTW